MRREYVAMRYLPVPSFSYVLLLSPAYATAGALLYVAVLMAGSLAHANWEDPTDAAPVLIAALAMPLTFSIAEGIALGFISYVAIKTLSGRFSDLKSRCHYSVATVCSEISFPGVIAR